MTTSSPSYSVPAGEGGTTTYTGGVLLLIVEVVVFGIVAATGEVVLRKLECVDADSLDTNGLGGDLG
jgi:hypothetical protein